MLTLLRIKNLALVEDLTLELESGYNAITGETGAGKSIIIGALSLVLGERADRTLIRSGSESCSVEAVFELPALRARLKSFLEGNGLEDGEGHQLVLKRTFSTNGTNRQFVNGSPTTLAVLASLGEWLVDIHGPHDHQSLLRPAVQLAILDAFGGVQEQREAFGGLVRRRAVLEAEKSQLAGDDASLAREIELLRFQAREIGEAHLKTGEEDLLRQEFERSSNAAKLLDLCQAAQGLMSESESSLLNLAGSLGRTLQALNKIDAGAAGLLEQQEQFTGCLRELQNEVSRYADKIEVNSERLKELEDRLDLVHSLKRKYGATIEEVLAHEQKAEQKLQQLEQRDAELSRISSEIATADAELRKTGQALSRRREKIIPLLCKSATKELKALGFASSHFEVSL